MKKKIALLLVILISIISVACRMDTKVNADSCEIPYPKQNNPIPCP